MLNILLINLFIFREPLIDKSSQYGGHKINLFIHFFINLEPLLTTNFLKTVRTRKVKFSYRLELFLKAHGVEPFCRISLCRDKNISKTISSMKVKFYREVARKVP